MSMSPAYPLAVSIFGSWNAKPAVGHRIVGAIHEAHSRRATRRAYEDLLARDDCVLRDVGVTRSDVRRAMAESHG